jgi:hypothetical protein
LAVKRRKRRKTGEAGESLFLASLEICQLSLWIKTAARGKRLTSLDHTIREGNSIISDPAVHPKPYQSCSFIVAG